jgi:hypothetical protein
MQLLHIICHIISKFQINNPKFVIQVPILFSIFSLAFLFTRQSRPNWLSRPNFSHLPPLNQSLPPTGWPHTTASYSVTARVELASSSSPSRNGPPLCFPSSYLPSTPVTDTLKCPQLSATEPPSCFHISALLRPYKSHLDPPSLHRASLPFPILSREPDLDDHPRPLPFTIAISPNPLPVVVFCR